MDAASDEWHHLFNLASLRVEPCTERLVSLCSRATLGRPTVDSHWHGAQCYRSWLDHHVSASFCHLLFADTQLSEKCCEAECQQSIWTSFYGPSLWHWKSLFIRLAWKELLACRKGGARCQPNAPFSFPIYNDFLPNLSCLRSYILGSSLNIHKSIWTFLLLCDLFYWLCGGLCSACNQCKKSQTIAFLACNSLWQITVLAWVFVSMPVQLDKWIETRDYCSAHLSTSDKWRHVLTYRMLEANINKLVC